MSAHKRMESCPGALHRGAEPGGAPGNGASPGSPRRRKRSPAGPVLFAALLCGVSALMWLIPRLGRETAGNGLGPSFALDVESEAHFDPRLIVCREAEPIPLDLREPRALAVGPDGAIAVCGGGEAVVMDPDGRVLRRFAVGADAHCAAFAPDGALYIGAGGRVEVYAPDGACQAVWSPLAEASLVGGIAALDDRVFVADAGVSALFICDKSGRPVHRIDGFVLFSSVYFDVAPAGGDAVWVANPGGRELRRYDSDGNLLDSWKRVSRRIDGFSGCCNPMHLAVRRDGTLATSEKNIFRVKLLDPAGALVGVVAGPASFPDGTKTLDLAVDGRDRILALDAVARAVRVFVDNPKPAAEGDAQR